MGIDRVASVCSLARNLRDAIDPARIDITVNAAQLKLVIDTFLEVATPPHHQKHADVQARTVMGVTAAVSEMERGRGR